MDSREARGAKRFVAGMAVSLFMLCLAVRKVSWHELTAAFLEARYAYLIPVVVLTLVSVFLRAWRWRFLLAPVGWASLPNLFSATLIGLAANNLLPARLGEVARAYAIGRQTGLPVSASFATIVVERILDVFSLLGLLWIVLPSVVSSGSPVSSDASPAGLAFSWLLRGAGVALLVNLLAIAALAMLVAWPTGGEAFLSRLAGKVSGRLSGRLEGVVHSFVTGLAVYRKWRLLAASLVLSVAVWGSIVLAIHYAFLSVGLDLPAAAPVVLLVFLGIGLMIPSGPGFIGTFQWFTVASLSLFAVERSRALSFSILFHATQFLPITILGLIALNRAGLSLRSVQPKSDGHMS